VPTRNATGRSRRAASGWPCKQEGCVYTLHFARWLGNTASPRGCARHYTGFALEHRLDARIAEHRAGTCGVPLVVAFYRAGIGFEVVSVEYGVTRERENQLKLRGASRRCPDCRAERELAAELTMIKELIPA
jgi:hypothetical protein